MTEFLESAPSARPSRRAVVATAAWSVPAVAVAVAAPMASASGPVTDITVHFSNDRYGWPDTSVHSHDAKLAKGVSFTVLDQDGHPVSGASVTFTILEWDDNSLWFVSNPATPVGLNSETAAPQLTTITLTTDAAGVVSLDGYLRRGSDANAPDDDQLIRAQVTVNGVTKVANALWAISSTSSNFGNDDSDPNSGPKDNAQHARLGGGSWNF
ncbi:hypothetical protein HQQ81_20735 [Microbacteriaceae bacterium VKM Ac-2854]|nr:hypothetical protein [Microbacteriaceae bacterium VKM Ac-2854]